MKMTSNVSLYSGKNEARPITACVGRVLLYKYICMFVCIYVCMFVCIYVCMFVDMYVNVYVHVYVHVDIYAHCLVQKHFPFKIFISDKINVMVQVSDRLSTFIQHVDLFFLQ